jgi:DNA (cytosine-5)-methyltransferase 1
MNMMEEESPTVGGTRTAAVFKSCAVRRLTPVETSRLQAFPDDWTKYGKRADGTVYELADGPRYKLAGNAVTSSVAKWLGLAVIREWQP